MYIYPDALVSGNISLITRSLRFQEHFFDYYLSDEGGQSSRPIRHNVRDDTSSRWHGHLHNLWPHSCNHFRWQGTLGAVSLFASTRKSGDGHVLGGSWLGKSNGRQRTESKCRKDDHDLGYRPGPPAEFRRVSKCRLSQWSGQQPNLLQQMQALGAQEMQWAQALDRDLDYRCTWCQGTACPLTGRP